MNKLLLIFIVGLMTSIPASADEVGADIQASTANGDKVILHPNGRWEFVETKKAVEAAKISKQYPENQGCPPGAQGGLFGLGRCILPGDKEFNRRPLNGK